MQEKKTNNQPEINMKLSVQQYANMREALAYLSKQLNIDIHLQADCTITIDEIDEIRRELSAQVSDIELIGLQLGQCVSVASREKSR